MTELKEKECIRVESIDPSTTHMGICIIDVNIVKPTPFKLIYANSIHGDKVNYQIPAPYDDNGVQARIYGLARAYRSTLDIFNPDIVICEDNFLGPDPSTFKRLIETVGLLREQTSQYGLGLFMTLVLPRLAKEIVGANFKGTKKEDVLKGVLDYHHLDLNGIDITGLDDHTIDAIAINLYQCELLAKEYKVFVDAKLAA